MYRIDTETGALLGTVFEHPARYVGMPGFTEVAPPDPVEGAIWCFRNGVWESVANHVGQTWQNPDTGEQVLIRQPGVTPETGWVQVEPM